MKILLCLQTTYAPNASSGADVMAERIGTYLAGRGHDVIAVVYPCPVDYIYKGVKVTSSNKLLGERFDWCDIVLTNLVTKGEAIKHAKRFNKPCFHLVHNHYGSNIPAGTPDNYLIFNSHHLANSCHYGLPSLVINPPTNVAEWANDIDHYTAKYVTLINCVHNKGHDTLVQLAINMPHMQFLGVQGGYGTQGRKIHRNLTYKPFTPGENAMREIYNQTRIIIVPSITESWSLVASEAQASGIPVICSDLPGLRENMKNSAMYVTGTRGYIDGINWLSNSDNYKSAVLFGKAQQWANGKDYLIQLEEMESTMRIVSNVKNEETGRPISEKVIFDPTREKVEHTPAPEKKIIRKPGRPAKIK